MKLKMRIKAGRIMPKDNQTQRLKVRTDVKAGVGGVGCPEWGCGTNHNQKVARGLKIKTNIKAGPSDSPVIRD